VIIKDFNFEILPDVDADDGVLFGIGQDVSLDDGGFTPGSTDWATQDAESSQNGTTAFGRDRLLGPTWNWQLHVNRDDDVNALESLAELKTAWRALHIRNTPGAVLPLRYRLAGRTRRIYGRPRRFEESPTNTMLGGHLPISVDFKCVDGFTYDDVMQNVSMRLGQELEDEGIDTGGGFIFPLTFPTITLPPTKRQSRVLIGGDAPAYPIIRFQGPVTNPVLITDDWRIGVTMQIQDGQYVEIDTRPWKQTALLNGNASVAGLLGRKTRMDKVVFNPGVFEARYNGFSSGETICTVRWANTWNSL
jgi:hypothetical protein